MPLVKSLVNDSIDERGAMKQMSLVGLAVVLLAYFLPPMTVPFEKAFVSDLLDLQDVVVIKYTTHIVLVVTEC